MAQEPVNSSQKGGYGKRPWWHWLLLYLLVGAVVYLVIYYFLVRGDSGGLTY